VSSRKGRDWHQSYMSGKDNYILNLKSKYVKKKIINFLIS
jgi:hypothetical protein